MGKNKVKRKYTESSGARVFSKRRRLIYKLKAKVRRWEKNKSIGKPVSENAKNLSRYNWDTSGLEKHIAFLETLV